MAQADAKSFDSPDETREFEGKGRTEVVKVGGDSIGRSVFEPGWRWSQNIKPIAGTDSCQVHHVGYCLSGRMKVYMDDGGELEIGPGDAFVIPPGHDAEVVGDEDCVSLEFGGAREFAKR
jgi:mannose-6-phosphate isomerase-like protein (cupin superfamily)